MVLESTQLLRVMSTRYFSWERKGGWCQGLAIFTPSCTDYLGIWESEFPGNLKPPFPVSTPETEFPEMQGFYL